jgi:V8-like Glu-specific endopeptidase
MAVGHRFSGQGARATVRLAAITTVLTGGMTVLAISQSSGDMAAVKVAASVSDALTPGPTWTAPRMADATPSSPADASASAAGASVTATASPASSAPPASTAGSAAPTRTAEPAPSAAPITSAAGAPPKAPAATHQQNATSFTGTPTVGILFFTDKSAADHYCTASVVDSPAGDLVITAGHCVYSAADGYKSDIAFVPGYHDGQSPYGQWTPAQIIVAADWRESADPNVDVGFLRMAESGSGASIESVTGAGRIAFGTGFGQQVAVPAYPVGDSSPVICANPTSEFSPTQTEFDCGGYPDGTSGAPLLTGADSSGAHGTVIGVIGGYEEGGDTPSVSYSAYFGSAVQALYRTAVATG